MMYSEPGRIKIRAESAFSENQNCNHKLDITRQTKIAYENWKYYSLVLPLSPCAGESWNKNRTNNKIYQKAFHFIKKKEDRISRGTWEYFITAFCFFHIPNGVEYWILLIFILSLGFHYFLQSQIKKRKKNTKTKKIN